MMIPMWMDTSTPPHIVAEARARLKLVLEKKGLIQDQGWHLHRWHLQRVGGKPVAEYATTETVPTDNLQRAFAEGYKEVAAPNLDNGKLWTMDEYSDAVARGRDLRIFSPQNVGKTGARNFIVVER